MTVQYLRQGSLPEDTIASRAALRPRSEALKRLVLEMYVRGRSTRDVEAFRVEVLSRSGVSRMGKEPQAEFDRWRVHRDH